MPWLTALENLRLVCDDRGRALAALEAVGLSAELGKYPRQLSGGMQRRVALARAMLLKPRLLLMDEPFVSLDRATAASCRATLLNYWREQGVAVIFVTHDLDEAVALADRVLVLAGRPASVLHELKVDLPRPRDLLSSSVVGVVGELAERLKVDRSRRSGVTRYCLRDCTVVGNASKLLQTITSRT